MTVASFDFAWIITTGSVIGSLITAGVLTIKHSSTVRELIEQNTFLKNDSVRVKNKLEWEEIHNKDLKQRLFRSEQDMKQEKNRNAHLQIELTELSTRHVKVYKTPKLNSIKFNRNYLGETVETHFTTGLDDCGKVVEKLEVRYETRGDVAYMIIHQLTTDKEIKEFTYREADVVGLVETQYN